MSSKFLCLMSFAMVSSLQALVEKKIDEKKPLEVVFSRNSHNRISIEGGAVEKVFADGSIFSITIDKTTGNAFVNVLQDLDSKTITLTVVTSSGCVQDLSVSSHNGPSEQVILKDDEDDLDETVANTEVYHAASVDLLNKILEGKTPIGYGKTVVREEDGISVPKPLMANPIKAFEGVFETIVVYLIKNEGKQPVEVTSDSFRNDNNSWVFLNVQELAKNEQAICIISYPKL